ncbi:OmpA family protein [candidate division TA06 bacterium]|nr:OmpA family protein [candidate division TA06 bacterium]
MKQILWVAGVAFFWTHGMGFAAPSITGQKGLYRVLAADVESRGDLHFNFHMRASYVSRDTFFLNQDTTDTVPIPVSDFYGNGDFNFNIGYDIVDYLSASIGGVLHGDAIDTDNDDLEGRRPPRYESPPFDSAAVKKYLGWRNRRSIGIGDLEGGVKFSYPVIHSEPEDLKLTLGLYPFFTAPIGTQRDFRIKAKGAVDDNTGGVFRFFTTNDFDFGFLFLTSLKTPGESPVSFHSNIGYNIHNHFSGIDTLIQGNDTLFSVSGNIDNQLLLGFGSQVRLGEFAPFIEVSTKRWIHDKDDILGVSPVLISPGLRFSTKGGFNFDLGADFRVSEENKAIPDSTFYVTTGYGSAPTWSFHLGFSINYDMIVPPKAPPAGIIVGIVKDAETGDALSATLSFPEVPDTVLDPISADPASGRYEKSMPPGVVRIQAEKEGYETGQKAVVVKEGETIIVDFQLKRKVIPKGKMTGKVTDRFTGTPVGATISFPGTELTPTVSDLTTGIYSADLPSATYTVEISAEGYISQAAPIVIEQDKTFVQNFELLPKGGKLSLKGITFEFGKATIKPESYPILNEAVEMLQQSPRVKVEIQGHTDSVGSDAYNLKLSQKRAQSVLNHMIQQRIDAWRLTSRGFGESMPVASNKTNSGRAQNRRIDFLILGE